MKLTQILTTDHRKLGLLYLALSATAVAIGTVLSLFMRLHLVWPGHGLAHRRPG